MYFIQLMEKIHGYFVFKNFIVDGDLSDEHTVWSILKSRGYSDRHSMVAMTVSGTPLLSDSTPMTDLACRPADPNTSRSRSEFFEHIEGFYNPFRRHKHLAQLSPLEFERQCQTAL